MDDEKKRLILAEMNECLGLDKVETRLPDDLSVRDLCAMLEMSESGVRGRMKKLAKGNGWEALLVWDPAQRRRVRVLRRVEGRQDEKEDII